MTKDTTVAPAGAAQKTAEQTLSRYTSVQLQSKLRENKLFGVSKDVALSILKKREVDISEFTNGKAATSTDKKTVEKKSEKKEEKVLTPETFTKPIKKGEKAEAIKETKADKSVSKVEKVEKKTGEKKEKKKRKELTAEQKKEIAKLSKDGSSIYFIRKKLGVSWSAVNREVNGK
jgi:hypothetical protein